MGFNPNGSHGKLSVASTGKFKQPKGYKTQIAMRNQLAKRHKVSDTQENNEGDNPHEMLKALQDVDKDQKIYEENEKDIWLEMILAQRSQLRLREAHQDQEMEEMIEN